MSTEIKAQIREILRRWVAGTIYKILHHELHAVPNGPAGMLAMLRPR